MNVWIVNPYGTLPSEGWREYRSAMLARALARRGHRVRWWLSDIEHRSKQRRPITVVDPLLPAEVSVQIVEAPAYHRNISLGRIRYERGFGAGFAHVAATLPRPDLIVLADPSLFFGGPVVDYARRHRIPFVLDILDLWPELFDVLLPRRLRRLGRMLFARLYRRRDRLVAAARAVVAVTGDYLETVTRRHRPARAMTIYLGVDTTAFPPLSPPLAADAMLEVVYAGTLGDAYDMAAMIKAIDRLANEGHAIRFTLAGDGPWRAEVEALATRHPDRVRFIGKVPASALATIYAAAHVGIASYAQGSTVSMPVKFYDYMAAGLATVGSMGGEAGDLLERGAGLRYRAGDSADMAAQLLRYRQDLASLEAARNLAWSMARDFDQHVQHDRFAELIEDVLQDAEC